MLEHDMMKYLARSLESEHMLYGKKKSIENFIMIFQLYHSSKNHNSKLCTINIGHLYFFNIAFCIMFVF